MAHYWDQCQLLKLWQLLRSVHIIEISASYWNYGTLMRSVQVIEIMANYWDQCTLLRSVHFTEIMVHYWDHSTLLRPVHITEIMTHFWDHDTLLREWYILRKKRTRTFSVVHNVLNEKQTPGKCRDITCTVARESTLVTKRRQDKTPSRKSTHLSRYCLCLEYCNWLRVMWWPGTKIQWGPDWWCFGQASSVGLM